CPALLASLFSCCAGFVIAVLSMQMKPIHPISLSHTHTQTYIYTHTKTHAHAHTHTHTHTHTPRSKRDNKLCTADVSRIKRDQRKSLQILLEYMEEKEWNLMHNPILL